MGVNQEGATSPMARCLIGVFPGDAVDDFDGMDDEEGDLSFVRCAILTYVSVYLGTPICSQGSKVDEFALQTHYVENSQPAGVRQSQDSPPSLIRRAGVWNIQPHSNLL